MNNTQKFIAGIGLGVLGMLAWRNRERLRFLWWDITQSIWSDGYNEGEDDGFEEGYETALEDIEDIKAAAGALLN